MQISFNHRKRASAARLAGVGRTGAVSESLKAAIGYSAQVRPELASRTASLRNRSGTGVRNASGNGTAGDVMLALFFRRKP